MIMEGLGVRRDSVPSSAPRARYATSVDVPEPVPATSDEIPERAHTHSPATEGAEADRLALALEIAALGLWEIDLADGTLSCTAKCKANAGLPPDAPFDYAMLLAVIHPDDRVSVQGALENLAATGSPYVGEHRVIWPDGSVHWIAARGRAHPDATGKPGRMVGVTQDVTDRVTAAEQLAASEARYRLLADHSTDMISVHTPDGAASYLYASPAATLLFGYSPAELIGRSAYDFFHPDDLPALHDSQDEAMSGVRFSTITYRLKTRHCGYTWVESTSSAILDAATGVPSEIISSTRSVEARVAAEQERARAHAIADSARQKAEEANRAKSDFLAMMSHELRTPLNAIAGHVQLIEMGLHGPVTEPQHDALARVDRAQRHLLRLVNDVLNFARLQSSHIEYDVGPVPLADVISDLDPLIGPQLQAKSLSYTVDVPQQRIVQADHEKLVQVLLNLLSNAVKFTPEGGAVSIQCAQRSDGTGDPACVFLRVSDTGIGIAQEKLDAIFEPFVQVDTTSTGRVAGTGLGLAISRDLVRGMGGDIRV
ncbi:MAG: PAS domain-containing sensor histidine kinase, partial [Gemmatimonadaceae bacterium]